MKLTNSQNQPSVRSGLSWWRKRAKEHKISPYPVTVEHLQLLGTLLKRAGYRSAGAYLSVVKNQHIRLGHPWSDTLDLELRKGKRACERGIGPQKLADAIVGNDPCHLEGVEPTRTSAVRTSRRPHW